MRKLLTFLIALAAIVAAVVSPVSAQGFNGGGFNVGNGPFASGGGGGCTQATSFLSRTTYTGSDVTNFTNLICGLVSTTATEGGTLWARFDMLLIFATADSTNALINLVNSTYSASATSPAATFTAYRGFAGNGGTNTAYVYSTYNASTAGGNYTQNSAHISCWNLTATVESAFLCTTASANIYPEFSGSDFYFRVNETSSSSVAITGSTGFLLGNRTDSLNEQGYKNATSLGTHSVSSAALVNSVAQPVAQGSTRQNAMFSAGASLSATDEANFYSLLRTYMTAVGVP